ncbi:MAG: CRISPR-associated endonuclease Cas2 [Deltaproteobacteria bacterium]|nr:CRISPR-associated endonuclease Cas2 [Deltaproteobacteria bacterium]
MFCLVCFDIVDDRIRYRAVKIIKAYGIRVQKSVFECTSLTEEQFLKMKQRLEDCIDSTQDSVRFYFLCRQCLHKVECSGVGEIPEIVHYRIC